MLETLEILRDKIETCDEEIKKLKTLKMDLLLEYQNRTSEYCTNDIIENSVMKSKKYVFLGEYRIVGESLAMVVRQLKGAPTEHRLGDVEIIAVSPVWSVTGKYKG